MARQSFEMTDPPYRPIREDEWLRRKMANLRSSVNIRRGLNREERLNEKILELTRFVYPDREPLDGWWKREALYRDVETFEYVEPRWQRIRIGEVWGSADRICFFRRRVRVPKRFAGRPVVLRMDVGGESTVFINGVAGDSLDPHRHEILLTERARGGETFDVRLETHVWSFPDDVRTHTEGDSHRLEAAELRTVDREVERCLYDFRVAYDAALAQADRPEIFDFILSRVETAMDMVERYAQDAEVLKRGLRRGSAFLRRELYKSDAYRVPGRLCLVAHSHLDIAFHWWIHHGARKTRRTMAAQLALMDRYPEFRFCQSQPKTFNDLKVHYPEVYARVREAVRRGQLEVIGGMWIEPDGNLPSGESFVRQVLFGQRFWMREFGVMTRTCWVPDIFGCTWILPQILKRAGMDFFVTHKQSTWNDTNSWPYSLFMWRGPDGSEVLGCIPPTHFIGQCRPEQLRANWEGHRQRHIFPQSMCNYGWGNGGGGPTPDMIEYAKRLRRFPGLPSTEITSAEEYLRRAWRHRRALPVWEDELYLEMHRGTYTTKGALKRCNRKAEFLLREAEIFSSLARLRGGGADTPQADLNDVWADLLVNQFHDILPGSHVHAVAEKALPLSENVCRRAEAARDAAVERLAGRVDTCVLPPASPRGADIAIVVFNSLNWRRSDVVRVTAPTRARRLALVDGDGRPVPFQEVRRTAGAVDLVFFAEDVPPVGYRAYRLIAGRAREAPRPAARCTRRALENAFFRIGLDRQAYFTSLVDKRAGRELLVPGRPGNLLQLFEDQPGVYDAWDISLTYRDLEWPVKGLRSFRVVESGPVRTVVRTRRRVRMSTVTQDIVLYEHLPRIDFVTHVDWRERQKLLKVAFPLDIHAREAAYDLDYGTIRRPTHRNTSWDRAKFEVCAHKWADLSEGDYGVSLLNDCKYGYDIERLGPGEADGNLMRLTLLKGSVYPDEWADWGEHTFTYALYPHAGSWAEGGTVRQAYQLNVPLRAVCTRTHAGDLPPAVSWLSLDAENVFLGALKRAEGGDDLILRLVELHNARRKVQVRLGLEVSRVSECDLLERDERTLRAGRRSFRFEMRPAQIRTFRLKPHPGAPRPMAPPAREEGAC